MRTYMVIVFGLHYRIRYGRNTLHKSGSRYGLSAGSGQGSGFWPWHLAWYMSDNDASELGGTGLI